MDKQDKVCGWLEFGGYVVVLFSGLRVMGCIDWDWVWVLCSLWIPLIVGFLIRIGSFIVGMILLAIEYHKGNL